MGSEIENGRRPRVMASGLPIRRVKLFRRRLDDRDGPSRGDLEACHCSHVQLVIRYAVVEHLYQGRDLVVPAVLSAKPELLHPRILTQLGVASMMLHMLAHREARRGLRHGLSA